MKALKATTNYSFIHTYNTFMNLVTVRSVREIIPVISIAACILFSKSNAFLRPESGTRSITILREGSGQYTHRLRLRTSSAAESVKAHVLSNNSDILTSRNITVTPKSETDFIIDVTLVFEGFPGALAYTIIADHWISAGIHASYNHTAVHLVHGLVFSEREHDQHYIRSGSSGAVLAFESTMRPGVPARVLEASVYPPWANLSNARLRVSDSSQEDTHLLSSHSMNLSEGHLSIRPNDFRIGSGRAFVHVTIPVPGIPVGTLESIVMVTVPVDDVVPPVVVGSQRPVNISVNHRGVAKFSLDMFNVPNGFLELQAVVDDTTFEAVRVDSELGLTDQRIVFGARVRESFAGNMNDSAELLVRMRNEHGLSFRAERVATPVRFSVVFEHKKSRWPLVLTVVTGSVVVAVLIVFFLVAALKMTRKSRRVYLSDVESGAQSWIYTVPSCSSVHISRDVYGRGSVVLPSER